MSKQRLRYAILVFGLIAGVINLFILPAIGFEWLLMPLNGLGYIILTGLVFFDPAFLSKWRKELLYLFMAYNLITIVGYFYVNIFMFGPLRFKPLDVITKVDEVLLMLALWLYKDK